MQFVFADTASLKILMQDEIQNAERVFPEELRKILVQKHFVFVDGIINELANISNCYFTDNLAELARLGVSYTHLRYFSRDSIPENGKKLALDLRKIAQEARKPIVLVGHSMGGAESLYAVLSDIELFLSQWVEKVILLEAAIGGTPLAEKMTNTFMARMLQFYLNEGLISLMPPYAHSNFEAIYSVFYQSLVKRAKETNPENFAQETRHLYQDISDRIYYVRSSVDEGESLSLGVRVVLSFCQKNVLGAEKNDGLLNEEAQILSLAPDFGVDLGVLDADHIELVVSGIFSRANGQVRKAFTRALLKKVFENVSP